MPRFVTVRGGAYFFLPGIRALRYIAGATDAPIPDPIEPAPAASALLLALHRALVAGLHVERRLEPFFRRGLNRVLREPMAAFLQYLINRRRPNEGLRLAEERIEPDEEASLDSIIASFAGYMQRTYRSGTFERGGNTKTHGIVRADSHHTRRPARAHAPRHFRRRRARSRPTFASPDRGRIFRSISRTPASSAWRSS